MKIVSVDTETTGTNTLRGHRPWEVACVDENGEELHFTLLVDLSAADMKALQIGGYWDRFSERTPSRVGEESRNMEQMCQMLDGATLLGCAVHFDSAMLAASLDDRGACGSWSHRVLDLGSMWGGAYGYDGPQSTKTMALTVPNEQQHTALGDAKWNWDVYWHMREGRDESDDAKNAREPS